MSVRIKVSVKFKGLVKVRVRFRLWLVVFQVRSFLIGLPRSGGVGMFIFIFLFIQRNHRVSKSRGEVILRQV